MIHYFGAEAIATRLAIDVATVYRWRRDYGLPVFLRRHAGRRRLYASEAMLVAWELARSQGDRPARATDSRVKAGR